MYYGSWKVDDYLTFACNTHRFDTGAATDADSVPTYRIYEDESGTAVTNGSFAKLDDANTTGFYSEQVQLTTAAGFEKGKCYTIYVAATVNSVTATTHHTFQIEAEVDANAVSDGVTIADAVLNRNLATGTDSGSATVRTVRQALRALRNKHAVSGATLTVYKEDDTTASWTAELTTDPSAVPITAVDPASS